MHGWHWHGQLLFGGGVVTAWDVVSGVVGVVIGVVSGVIGVTGVVGVVIGVVGVVGVVTGGSIVETTEHVGKNWSMKSHRWFAKLKNWNGGHSRTKSSIPAPFPPHCQKNLGSDIGNKTSRLLGKLQFGAGHAGSATGSGGGTHWPWMALKYPKRTRAVIKIP